MAKKTKDKKIKLDPKLEQTIVAAATGVADAVTNEGDSGLDVKTEDTPPPKKDERDQKARRRDRLALKQKALDKADEDKLPWDDSVKAKAFEEDYDAAFAKATNADTGIDYEQRIAARAAMMAGSKPVVDKPEADPTVKSTAELLKAAKETMLPTNDNTETTDAVTTETAASEEPVEEAPTEEAPTDQPSQEAPAEQPGTEGTPADGEAEQQQQPDTTVASDDASGDTSKEPIVDANGQLVKLPGESNKAFNKRKHKHNLAKRAAEAAANFDARMEEGRNGAPPTPSDINKRLPTGDLGEGGYSSDADGQSLPIPEKSAKESANVFEAAAMAEEAPKALSEAATMAEAIKEQEAPVVEEKPVEEAPAEEKPEETKPTLTLVSSTEESPETIAAAQKFYGTTWNDERSLKLLKAYKFLMLAIKLQGTPGTTESRWNLPLTSAIRLENEALEIGAKKAMAA